MAKWLGMGGSALGSVPSPVDLQRLEDTAGLWDSFVTAQQPTCFSLKAHNNEGGGAQREGRVPESH